MDRILYQIFKIILIISKKKKKEKHYISKTENRITFKIKQ